MDRLPQDRVSESAGSHQIFVWVGAAALMVWLLLDPRPHAFALAGLLAWVGFVILRTARSADEPPAVYLPDTPSDRLRTVEGQREAWLTLLLGEVPAGLWVADKDLVLVSTQGQGLAALGVGTCRLDGVSIHTFLRSRDPEHPAIAAHRRALEGESVSFEQSWGRHVYQVTVGPLRDADGEIEGVVGLCLAITERVRHEEMLRTLVSGIATKTGRDCLSSLVRHLGLRLGVRHVCVVEFEGQPPRMRSLAAWSSTGAPPSVEQGLIGSICQDIEAGEWRHVEQGGRNRFPEDAYLARLEAEGLCAIGLAGPQGVAGALLIVDVVPLSLHHLERASVALFAERAAAELEREHIVQALTLSEQRFRLLAENVPGVIYLCRQNEHATPIFLSDGVEELTGYSHQSFMEGKVSLNGLCHPDDQERVNSEMAEALEGKKPFHLRYRILHADGRWCWLEEMGVGVDADPRERLREGFLWDVTAGVEAEQARDLFHQQVLQSQKVESLGVLAGGIAHEFNNLLTTILGNVELLDRSMHPSPAVQGAVRGVERAAVRGRELASKMLEYAGKGRYAFERVDLGRLLDNMQNLFRASVGARAAVRVQTAANLTEVSGDPVQLRHVLMNLVLNSAEAVESAGREDGLIVIHSERSMEDEARLLPTKEGLATSDVICIEVRDNGCGLDEDTRERIFDPFFTTKFTGRGLGLAATFGIVRAHGGTISVESAGDHGSTFRVWLPVAEPVELPEVDEQDEGDEPIVELVPTLLVVDDEQVVRSLAENVLARAGYRVVTAADGQRAVDLVRDHPDGFHLALVDVSMPGLDGMGTVEELARIAPTLPVVLSSGYGRSDNPPSSAGVAAFLSKPYRPSELVDKVREVLGITTRA